MHMIGLVRLGRDMELRFVPNGSAVGQLSLAYNWGKKDEATAKRPTQWIEAAIFGDRAKNLEPYLKKGTAIVVTLDEVRVEEYKAQNGDMRSSLKARVVDIEFAGGDKAGDDARPGKPRSAAPKADLDDDIPF